MKKRWGVRVIAILMLIAGLLLFLLGIVPAILAVVRGIGTGLSVWLAIPSALGGCAGALFLVVAGTVLLSLGRIADNFAAVSQPAPDNRVAPAAAKLAAPAVTLSEDRAPAATAVAAMPALTAVPEAETVQVPVAAAPVMEPIASPQEEVNALQAQLTALQTQLDELGEPSPGMENLPAVVEDEGPAPGAMEEPRLPGTDEAARVAAEMGALDLEAKTVTS